MEKSNDPLLSWYVNNYDTIYTGTPAVTPLPPDRRPVGAADVRAGAPKPATSDEPRKRKNGSGVGTPTVPPPIPPPKKAAGFWSKAFFVRKKTDTDALIVELQKPMPLFEAGVPFEYRYDVTQKECGDEPAKFVSFKVHSNGPAEKPIVENLKAELAGNELVLGGLPQNVGHLEIDLEYERPSGSRIVYRVGILYVKPTRRCQPHNSSAPFQVEDKFSKYAVLGDWGKIAGGSIRGRDHEHQGSFREDCFDFTYVEAKKIGALVVSDGAGSAEFSRKGAEMICTSFCRIIGEYIDAGRFDVLSGSRGEKDIDDCKAVILEAARRTHAELRDFSTENGIEFDKLYATMLACLFIPLDAGIVLISFAVGDGAMVAINPDGVVNLADMDHGRLQNETLFLSETIFENKTDLAKRVKFFKLGSPCTVLTMSDGVFNPWFEMVDADDQGVWLKKNEELSSCFDTEDPAGRIEEMLGFKSSFSNDDRTIVVLEAGGDHGN